MFIGCGLRDLVPLVGSLSVLVTMHVYTDEIGTGTETGEWPKDFAEVTMIALKKKVQATKCSDHCTISLTVRTAKIIAKILKEELKRKLTMYFEKISLDSEEEKKLRMQLE